MRNTQHGGCLLIYGKVNHAGGKVVQKGHLFACSCRALCNRASRQGNSRMVESLVMARTQTYASLAVACCSPEPMACIRRTGVYGDWNAELQAFSRDRVMIDRYDCPVHCGSTARTRRSMQCIIGNGGCRWRASLITKTSEETTDLSPGSHRAATSTHPTNIFFKHSFAGAGA